MHVYSTYDNMNGQDAHQLQVMFSPGREQNWGPQWYL